MAKPFAKTFYASKEWKAVREYCMMRDKFKCQRCTKPAEEVHHIKHLTPENIGDVNVTLNPLNLICLCRDCHQREHEADRYVGAGMITEEEKDLLHLDYEFDEYGQLIRKS